MIDHRGQGNFVVRFDLLKVLPLRAFCAELVWLSKPWMFFLTQDSFSLKNGKFAGFAGLAGVEVRIGDGTSSKGETTDASGTGDAGGRGRVEIS